MFPRQLRVSHAEAARRLFNGKTHFRCGSNFWEEITAASESTLTKARNHGQPNGVIIKAQRRNHSHPSVPVPHLEEDTQITCEDNTKQTTTRKCFLTAGINHTNSKAL